MGFDPRKGSLEFKYINNRLERISGFNSKLLSFDKRIEETRIEVKMLRNDKAMLLRKMEKLEKLIASMRSTRIRKEVQNAARRRL